MHPHQAPRTFHAPESGALYGFKPRRVQRGIFLHNFFNENPASAQVFYIEIEDIFIRFRIRYFFSSFLNIKRSIFRPTKIYTDTKNIALSIFFKIICK